MCCKKIAYSAHVEEYTDGLENTTVQLNNGELSFALPRDKVGNYSFRILGVSENNQSAWSKTIQVEVKYSCERQEEVNLERTEPPDTGKKAAKWVPNGKGYTLLINATIIETPIF